MKNIIIEILRLFVTTIVRIIFIIVCFFHIVFIVVPSLFVSIIFFIIPIISFDKVIEFVFEKIFVIPFHIYEKIPFIKQFD